MNRKKSSYETRNKRLVRIVCFIMAALMILGSMFMLFQMLIFAVSAASPLDTAQDDITIRVGLMYGDGVTVGFETTAPNGFEIGVQNMTDGGYPYHPFWNLSNTKVSVTADANLSKTDSTYSITANPAMAVIGGYHIEFAYDYPLEHMQTAVSIANALNSAFGAGNVLYAFPAYSYGCIRVRVGSFSSYDQASMYLTYVSQLMNSMPAQIVAPSSTGVSVVDPDTDRILFEYDNADRTALGLYAVQDIGGTKTVYTTTPAKNVYDGVFAYSRYREEGVDGVAVTNVLPLDAYVEGVVPYEIINTWPIETQKAFAITVRTYTAHVLGRHATAYGFDICNDTHCQAYRGAGRVNQMVIDAVTSTHGLILTYNGDVARTYYSASAGGGSVSIADVWGGDNYPYLVARDTPWENYTKHPNGLWTVEVSPTELLTYLRDTKGHTELGGYITSIDVLEYAPGSTYIKKLRITASNGASIELNNTDRVRGQLSAYVKSANFVVGRGSVEYTVDTVETLGETVIDNAVEKDVRPPVSGGTTSGSISTMQSSAVQVLTAEATTVIDAKSVPILTASGTVVAGEDVCIQTADGLVKLAASAPTPTVPGGQIQLPRTIKEYAVTTETKVAVASNPNNFIIVGKGWGHGGGMSQYGARDLGLLGYDYEHIINAYFTGVDIVYYTTLDKFKK